MTIIVCVASALIIVYNDENSSLMIHFRHESDFSLELIEVNWFPIDHLDLLISNFRIMIVTSLSDVIHIVGKLIEFSFQRYALKFSTSENFLWMIKKSVKLPTVHRYALQFSKSENYVTIMNRIFEIDKSRWSIRLQLKANYSM